MQTTTNKTETPSLSTYSFKIDGMTCGSCVEKISQQFKLIPGVNSVDVNLNQKRADIKASQTILLKDVKAALNDLPKYKADFYDDIETSPVTAAVETTFFQTYKPLITVFGYVLIFSISFQVSLGTFSAHYFMNHLMAGFFIGLSFFKFLNLSSFATSFSNYDPLAKKWKTYGLIYPFIELALGFLFIAHQFLLFANVVTIVVLGITTVGVYQKIKSKTQFQCACLGAGFNLPLSNVTIFENLAMITMALMGIFVPF